MSIPLRLIEAPGPPSYDFWNTKAGDCWPCHYAEDAGHVIEGRPPCHIIRLPGGGGWWHTNGVSSSDGQLWTVTGEAPKFTVQPSINVGPEIWHGWLTNGELSPDADSQGRT